MLIVITWTGGKGDASLQRQQAGTDDMLALSFRLKQLAENPERWRQGRRKGERIAFEDDAEGLDVAPEDAVITYRREGDGEAQLEWLAGVAPTPEQLWTASVLVEEMARHDVRKLLTSFDVQQAERAHAAASAIERVAGRPDFGRTH